MFEIRTDLAEELRAHAMGDGDREPSGVRFTERTEEEIRISTVDILDERGEKNLGRPRGRYITLTYSGVETLFSGSALTLCDKLAREIRALCGDIGSVLVLGLGNRALSADAVGVIAASHVLPTHPMRTEDETWFRDSGLFDVSVLMPDVMSKTGLETSSLVHFAVKDLCPDAIIAVDSLAARDSERLARTIQISDAGITPGSGIGMRRGTLNPETLGVPVIAIGVPTVVDTATLVRDALESAGVSSDCVSSFSGFFVSPKDIDVIAERTGKLIGFAISRAFQKGLSYEDLFMMI